ncbi:DNA polymerase [Candidatus Gracilibacteria bacterium]|nr:DNA polymerase [Candidatus Gracilibacteria bacterium]
MPHYYDTMLAEYIKNPGQRGLGLDALAEKYFEYGMISYSEITDKKKLAFRDVDLLKAAEYSGEDVLMTYKLYKEQQEKEYMQDSTMTRSERNNKKDILKDIELPLMLVLSQMETTGIKIDRDILKGIGMRLEQATSELEKEIHNLAEQEFNIKSPKQVGEILFDKLGYPTGKKTKTGYSVNAEVLDGLASQYPIAEKIVKYRHYTKLLSTYIDGLLEVASDNDRIHTSYNQTVTSTGRLSSTNPNLQNIPSGDDIAGEIRTAFIPDESGDKLIAFDYSQVEVRLLAIMSGDENLLKAFKDNRDIHQVTAEFIFGKTDISGTQRRFAKAVNFGVIYGISPFGLSKMIDVSQKDAKTYIEAFYTNYPKVREFYDEIILKCKQTGYVETLFGRKRFIKSINDQNKMMQSGAEREAINMPIQGTSADIIKIAMIQISKMLDEGKYKSTMLLQVHDELVFNIKPEEKTKLIKKIPEIMENILPNSPIDLKVDMGVGKNWKETK